MIILTLNAGSSSLKFNVINMKTEDSLADGIAERIGIAGGFIRWTIQGEKGRLELDMKDHKDALNAIMEKLHETVLKGEEVAALGHRVAHGGPNFGDPLVVTPGDPAGDRGTGLLRAAPQPRQRHGHPDGHGDVPQGAARRRLRHRLPPQHA